MVTKVGTLGARVRSAVLAGVGGLFDARPAGRLVAGLARLDFAATLVALDFVDVSDGAAVTAGGFRTFHTLGGNAATARVEGGHGVDALKPAHASIDSAELFTGGAGEGRAKNRLSALGRLRAAGARTRVGSRASRARRATIAVREGVARARGARLAVGRRDRTTGASSAGVGTSVGDGTRRAIRAHVVVRVGTSGAVLAAAVGIDLAVWALVDALVDGSRTRAASLAGRALGAGASASRRVGIFRAVRAGVGTVLGVEASGAGRALRAAPVLAGLAGGRALGRTGERRRAVGASIAAAGATSRVSIGRALRARRGVRATVGTSRAVLAGAVLAVLASRAADGSAGRSSAIRRGSSWAGLARARSVLVGESTGRARRAR